MKAVDYLKAKGRMTEGCGIYHCSEKCPLNSSRNGLNISCNNFENNYPEQAIEIVEKWAKEHPVKTYLSVLLEKFPKVPLDKKGVPISFCPEDIYGGEEWEDCNSIIEGKCTKCWNREYKEE